MSGIEWFPGAGCPKCPKPAPAPPPPPPPPPPPTPPPGGTPCIRFGNAIPSTHAVDATITQGSISHKWSNYRFSEFSDWVSVFHGGKGTITITDHAAGTKLLKVQIPLTPGPLVVVVKDDWPPTKQTAVEAIAASVRHGILSRFDVCPCARVPANPRTWPVLCSSYLRPMGRR